MKDKLSPLDQLRQDKIELKKLCEEQETDLAKDIFYLKHNWGSMLFRSISPFNSSSHSDSGSASDFFSGKSPLSGVTKAVSEAFPVIWDIAQPYLLGMAVRKLKNFFFRSKKKKKK